MPSLGRPPALQAVDVWQSPPWARPPTPPTVPLAEFQARLGRAQALAVEHGLDGLLVSDPANILWLSDFEMAGTFYFTQLVVPRTGGPALLTHRADSEIARRSSWIQDIVAWRHGQDHVEALRTLVARALRPSGPLRLGAEINAWYRIPDLERVQECLGAELVDVGPALEALRVTTSGHEVPHLERAAAIADGALAAAIGAARPGATEREVAAALARVYYRLGGQDPSVWPTVASGPRAAVRHAIASDRRLAAGETLGFEVWASSRRYTVVSGTTVSIGPPSAELLRRWEAVIQGLRRGLDALRVGAMGAEVHQAVVDGLGEFAPLAGHELGCGLGITFPLRPRWSLSFRPGNAARVAGGSVVLLAPSILDRAGHSVLLAQTYLLGDPGPVQLTRAPMTMIGV